MDYNASQERDDVVSAYSYAGLCTFLTLTTVVPLVNTSFLVQKHIFVLWNVPSKIHGLIVCMCVGCWFDYACSRHTWAPLFHIKRGNDILLFSNLYCSHMHLLWFVLVTILLVVDYLDVNWECGKISMWITYSNFIAHFSLSGHICSKSGREVLFMWTDWSLGSRVRRETQKKKGRVWWERHGVGFWTKETISGNL